MSNLIYLQGYPGQLLSQVRMLINGQRLDDMLVRRYPGTHGYTTNRTLWQHTRDLKNQFPRNAPSINKVVCNDKTHALRDASGLYTAVSRVQSDKLKAKAEIRVATAFHNALEPFLHMIVVHELAHLREKEYNRAFYQLYCHMEPQYHQLGFDIRLWLMQLSLGQNKI